jgi:hypothetical protein
MTSRQLGDRAFTATPAGYRALAAWLGEHGTLEMIGVEGTDSTDGAALARSLRTIGLTVVEVDRPDRKSRRAHAQVRPPRRLRRRQSCLVGVGGGDAEAPGWPRRGHPGVPRGPLQSAVKARSQATNQSKALIISGPPELRERLRHLPTA